MYDWCNKTGFILSIEKSTVVHFTRARKLQTEPKIYIGAQQINIKSEQKFLGLIFDKKLNWKTHITNLKERTLQSMNLIKTLSSTQWGSDKETLMMIYNSIIQSRLDYGSTSYSTASQTLLNTLNTVQNTGIRLVLGAYRTSPSISLICESGTLPLSYRRQKQIATNGIKILAQPNHPLYQELIQVPRTQSKTKTFKSLLQELLSKYEVNPTPLPNTTYSFPYWKYRKQFFDLSLGRETKINTPNEVFLGKFREKMDNFSNYTHLYTDGSKSDDSVGFGLVVYKNKKEIQTKKERLTKLSSIYSAELWAIKKALELIKTYENTNFVIITDSKSALQGIMTIPSNNQIIQQIQASIYNMEGEKVIKFLWVPSHIGILGNEKADQLAKQSLTSIFDPENNPTSQDLIATLKKKIYKSWSNDWNIIPQNKLRQIKNHVLKPTFGKLTRKESTVITRLRIGHTQITHKHIFEKQNNPQCDKCQSELTIEHILIDCPEYSDTRRKFQIQPNLAKALEEDNNSIQRMIQFLKTTELFHEI